MEKWEFPFPSRVQALSLFVTLNSFFFHAKGGKPKPWDLAGLTPTWGPGGWEGAKSATEVPWVDA